MNQKEMLESRNELNAGMSIRSEKTRKPMWKYWLVAAACLVLLLGIGIPLYLELSQPEEMKYKKPTEEAPEYVYEDTGKFVYNQDFQMFLSEEPSGSYTEKLTQEQLAYLLPKTMPEGITCEGYARFFPSGQLNYVYLLLQRPGSELELRVEMAASLPIEDYVKDMKQTQIGDTVFVAMRDFYQVAAGKRFGLQAVARQNDVAMEFVLHGWKKQHAEGNLLFEEVLICFAEFEEGKPDLSKVLSGNERFDYNEYLTLEQALQDAEFGSVIPAGMEAEYPEYEIYRNIGETENRINSVWRNESGFINWNVRWFSEQYDEPWMISAAERDKYDRSLHPLPWPAGMTEEQMQILEDPGFLVEEVTLDVVKARAYERSYDGKTCIAFFVKYKGMSIHISAYGAEPEYVYEQLMAVCGQ